MSLISREHVDELAKESLEILLHVYEELSFKTQKPPSIDILYNSFRESWLSEMHEYMTVNADSFEIDISEVTKDNLAAKLAEWGYPVPSQVKIHQVINSLGLSYVSHSKEWINCPIIEVW